MKKFFVFFILMVFSLAYLAAQEAAQSDDLFDWDIDTIFDEPFPDPIVEKKPDNKEPASTVLKSVKKRGLTVNASYEFQGAVAPGWNMAPWHFDGSEEQTWGQAVKMNSTLKLDAQISDVFRVRTVFEYNIPGSGLVLGDFFFDYIFFDAVFVRGGKYEPSWGISPNFGFTNLLSRVPSTGAGGDSYVLRADVPIGVGGIQALALTRVNLRNSSVVPHRADIGFGGKYNLALRWADFDIGVFYQEIMATRGFFSVKTTVWDVELYNEWLIAVKTHLENETSFAVNFGFGRDFFDEKLTINGEFFYNGEGTAYYYTPETNLRIAETSPFIEGFNMAMNLIYRFGGKGNPRFFIHSRYAPFENSAQLVPGFRLSPLSNINIYFAVPMALGTKDGYYYKHNEDPKNRPFSVTLLITLRGSVQAGYYY